MHCGHWFVTNAVWNWQMKVCVSSTFAVGRLLKKTVAVSGEGMNGEVYGAFMRLDGVGATDRTVTVDGVPRRYVETYKFDPSKHYLFPVPSKDIDLTNGSLTQNPGWN